MTKIPAISKAMIQSRWQDPHWKALYQPGTSCETVINDTAQRLPWNMINGRASKRHQIAIDDSTGTPVAYARWVLPSHLAEQSDGIIWEEAQIAEPTPEERARYEEDFKAVTDDDGQIRGLRMDLVRYRSEPMELVDEGFQSQGPFLSKVEPFLFSICAPVIKKEADDFHTPLALDYLATAPQYQRRGIGSLLLQKGLEVADAHGLKTFLTSSPAGLKVYSNHGFEKLETVTVDYAAFGGEEPVEAHFMIREAL
jgi:GNAT superfamily N-acetyltransferase